MSTPSIFNFLHFSCPTEQQKEALRAMASFVRPDNADDFLILCGAAGTGKTSITSALIGYLNAEKVHYRIAAPTARAARILGRKTKSVSGTVHSMIYIPEANQETGVLHFKLKNNENRNFTVFIIDEASMIPSQASRQQNTLFSANNSLLKDLVAFVKQGNSKNKVIFLGDRNQLPPIDEEDSKALQAEYLKESYNWQGNALALTEVKRQQDGSYIIKNAVAIREAIDSGKHSQSIEAFKHPNIFKAASAYVNDFKRRPTDSAISIGVSHKANKLFNKIVREELFGRNCTLVEKGDLMMVTQNWARNGSKLYNGDHVVIEEIAWTYKEIVAGLHFVPVKLKTVGIGSEEQTIEDYLLLDCLLNDNAGLDFGKENLLRAERFRKNKQYSSSGNPEDDRYVGAIRLAYGHSITCNKAQGGEWDKVYVNTGFIPNLKWSYTAVTRAKTELVTY